jgi:hypothetical protein
LAAPTVFAGSSANSGPTTWGGSADGTVEENGTATNESIGLSFKWHQVIAAQFTFSFQIGAGGEITGTGSGVYTDTSYSADGSYDQGPISCDVPLTGSLFTGTVSGQATYGQLTGQLQNIELHLALDNADETNPDTPCGSDYTIFAYTSTILADSLDASNPLNFNEASLGDHVEIVVPHSNGDASDGSTWTDDDTWDVGIQPSIGATQNHKKIWQMEADAANMAAVGDGTVGGFCGLLAIAQPATAPLDAICGPVFTAAGGVNATVGWGFGKLAVDPVDTHYTSVARPHYGHAPRLRPGHGLTAKQAAALNALMQAQFRAAGLASAVSTAFDRFSGAAIAANTYWQQQQREGARRYAGQLASTLTTELADAKRAQSAVAHSAFWSRKITAAHIRAFQAKVRSHGIPTALAAELVRLGLPAGDRALIRIGLEQENLALIKTPASFRTVLDFANLDRDARAAISALTAFSRTGE